MEPARRCQKPKRDLVNLTDVHYDGQAQMYYSIDRIVGRDTPVVHLGSRLAFAVHHSTNVQHSELVTAGAFRFTDTTETVRSLVGR